MQELEPVFEKVARYFSLLSDSSRLKVIHAICNHELSVSEVMSATGLTQSAVSRHLSNLHQFGVASRRKVGAQALYQITDRTLTDICRTACISLVSRDSEELMVAAALQARVGQFMPVELIVPEFTATERAVSQ
ncbi:MAG: metalloregulator ArsR/SmtB family transcription factor [Casimicrobium sp.]